MHLDKKFFVTIRFKPGIYSNHKLNVLIALDFYFFPVSCETIKLR